MDDDRTPPPLEWLSYKRWFPRGALSQLGLTEQDVTLDALKTWAQSLTLICSHIEKPPKLSGA